MIHFTFSNCPTLAIFFKFCDLSKFEYLSKVKDLSTFENLSEHTISVLSNSERLDTKKSGPFDSIFRVRFDPKFPRM